MPLKEQIISFIFSAFYGIIMSVVYNKCYKYLYLVKKIYCFFNNLLFYLDCTLIYFIVFNNMAAFICRNKYCPDWSANPIAQQKYTLKYGLPIWYISYHYRIVNHTITKP